MAEARAEALSPRFEGGGRGAERAETNDSRKRRDEAKRKRQRAPMTASSRRREKAASKQLAKARNQSACHSFFRLAQF